MEIWDAYDKDLNIIAIKEIGLTQIFLQTDAKAPAYRFYKNMGFTELEGHVSFAKRV